MIELTGKTQEDLDKEKQQQEQERINLEARNYLKDTDWYVIRLNETGKEIPQEIREKRQQARDSIK